MITEPTTPTTADTGSTGPATPESVSSTTAAVGPSSSLEAPTELTAVVDDLLDSLSSKFASVSSEIYEKIEAMSRRLDAMEQSLQQNSSGASTAGKA